MGTGEIELQTICYGCQLSGDLHEFLHRAAEDRNQQEAILWHGDLLQALQRFVHTRVSQPDGIDEAPWRKLAVDGLPVTQPRCLANTLGCDDANFGHGIDDPLNDGRRRCYDAGGNRKGSG